MVDRLSLSDLSACAVCILLLLTQSPQQPRGHRLAATSRLAGHVRDARRKAFRQELIEPFLRAIHP